MSKNILCDSNIGNNHSINQIRTVFKYAIGEQIKHLRIERGISGNELADLLNKSQQQISRYERGVSNITIDVLMLILYTFNTPVDDFFKDVYLKVFLLIVMLLRCFWTQLLYLIKNNFLIKV
jgi:transcriptional regulator with XRE-family HTH domain